MRDGAWGVSRNHSSRTARVLASLNHPHIAQIYGLETAPTPFIVMKLVTGESVDAEEN